MTRSQITNCNDCPQKCTQGPVKIWERYNWTTKKVEETREFDYNNTDDLNDAQEIRELALEWLQDEANFDNQDGEWTETGYVYFRGGETIEIRRSYYGEGVICGISGEHVHPVLDVEYCEVAEQENEIPTYERYNEKTNMVEKTVDVDEDDEEALEKAVEYLTQLGDVPVEDLDIYDQFFGYGVAPYDQSTFHTGYRTMNAKGHHILIRRDQP